LTLLDGANVIATAPYSGGYTVITAPSLGVGHHSISVVFSGNDDVAGSRSFGVDQLISQSFTKATVNSTAPISVYGQPVIYVATVLSNIPGAPFPGGTVAFYDGTRLLSNVSLANGQAFLTVLAPAVGTHSIYALYSGDANSLASSSDPLTQTVIKANSCLISFAQVFDRGVGLPVTVLPVGPSVAQPSGKLTFYANGKRVGTEKVTDGMAGLFFVPRSRALGKTFVVKYSGDDNLNPRTSTSIHITSAFLKGSPGSFQQFAKHAAHARKHK
jgi:hypothetical protein